MKQLASGKHIENNCFLRTLKFEMHSPCGKQLEVRAGSFDVNFFCDFLKLFLEVGECTNLVGI
jgi:hypothetical protein